MKVLCFFLLPFIPISSVTAAFRPQDVVVEDSSLELKRESPLPLGAFVLDKKTIERSAPQTLSDLLNLLPGIVALDKGFNNGTTSIFARGMRTQDLQVFIDGVMVNDPSTPQGIPNGLFLPPAEIERIIYNPHSLSLDGKGAAGSLSIETKSNLSKRLGQLKVQAGPYSQIGSVKAGHNGIKGAQSFSGSYREQGGLSSKSFPGGEEDESKGAYLRHSLDRQISEHILVRTILSNDYTEFEYDGFLGDDESHGRINHALANLELEYFQKSWSLKPALLFSRFDRFYHDIGAPPNRFQGQLLTPRLDYSFTSRAATWQLKGLVRGEFEKATLANRGVEDSLEENLNSYGLGSTLKFKLGEDRIDFLAKIRKTENLEHDFRTQIQWQTPLNSTWELGLNLEKSQERPEVSELFGLYSGNPDLENEDLEKLETIFKASLSKFAWRLSLFYQKIENQILYIPERFNYFNGSSFENWGQEMVVSYNGPQVWSADLSVTHVEIKDPKKVLRNPEWSGKFILGRNFTEKIEMQLEANLIGSRFDIPIDNPQELGLVQTYNTHFIYRFKESTSAKFSVVNLLNEEREMIRGYTRPGRQLIGSLQTTF